MPETIDVRLDFDFQGKQHALRSRIDLEPFLRNGLLADEALPDLYPMLAKDNGIDPYSYEYEVMQMEQPRIVGAEGWLSEFLRDAQLDWQGLLAAYRRRQAVAAIRPIARDRLGIDDLDQHPSLRDALIAAYRLGLESAPG